MNEKGGVQYGLRHKYQEEKLEEKEGQVIMESPVIVYDFNGAYFMDILYSFLTMQR